MYFESVGSTIRPLYVGMNSVNGMMIRREWDGVGFGKEGDDGDDGDDVNEYSNDIVDSRLPSGRIGGIDVLIVSVKVCGC